MNNDYRGKAFINYSFKGQDLEGAKFNFAELKMCDFNGANVKDADFRDVWLSDVKGLNIRDCNWEGIKEELFGVLSKYPRTVAEQLLLFFENGQIDGRYYMYRLGESRCGCVFGTMEMIIGHEPIERETAWRLQKFVSYIRFGDTPKGNGASALMVEWIKEWLNHANN